MALGTRSQFFYGFTVVENENDWIDFDEGGSEISFQLTPGDYSFEDYISAISSGMSSSGTQTYISSLNRSTRLVTISATANFSLLPVTGSHNGTSAFSSIGFTADKTLSNSYVSDSAGGNVYRPQFLLQNYIPTENFQRAVNETINETASGIVEVVKFGTVKYMQCSIDFATDIAQSGSGPIENNASGVSDLITFMVHCTSKKPVEFMADRDTPSTYQKLLLESTPSAATGTGFRLKEAWEAGYSGLANYYFTGNLTFRLLS